MFGNGGRAPCPAPATRAVSGAGDLPQHLANDVDLVWGALVGRVVRVGGDEAESASTRLTTSAVPSQRTKRSPGAGTRDEEAVAPAKLGLHRVAAHLEDAAERAGVGVSLVAHHGLAEPPAGLLVDEDLVPGTRPDGGLDLAD